MSGRTFPLSRPTRDGRARRALHWLWLLPLSAAVAATQPPSVVGDLKAGRDLSATVAALRAEASPAPARKVRTPVSAMQRYVSALRALRTELARTGERKAARAAALQSLQVAELLVQADFDRASALSLPGTGDLVATRVAAARARWMRASQTLQAALAPLSNSSEADTAQTAAAVEHLDALLRDAEAPVYGATLPQHRPRLLPRAPRLTPDIAPSYASNGVEVVPLAEDSAGRDESEATPALLQQAAALGHDYIAIADFVRTQVRAQWYAGAQKSADETLRTRAGNDTDQASLLIALLRASGAPARYVTGVVEVPVADLAAQLGVDDSRVGAALAAAGIAHLPVLAQGRVAAFRIEHVWVSTYVPYGNYRGSSADRGSRSWIPLMPALKPVEFDSASEVLAPADLALDTWIAQFLSTDAVDLPWPSLRTALSSRLAQRQPPLTLDALRAHRGAEADPLGLLPASTPYPVVAVNLEHPVLLDEQRQFLQLVLRDADGNNGIALDATWSLPSLASRRIGIGYVPATVEDQHLANARGGVGQVPAYLLRVRPTIWVDGRPASSGDGVFEIGAAHRIELRLRGPAGDVVATQTLRAGGIAAFALDPQGDAPLLADDAPVLSEPFAARALSAFAQNYLAQWSAADADAGATLGATILRPLPAATLAIAQYRLDEALGLASELAFEGVALDALLRPVEPITQRGDTDAERDWLQLSALHGSALEHALFDSQWGAESVSADKLLRLANDDGIPLLDLAPGADAASTLAAHSPAVREHVQGWLDRGLDVRIPRDPASVEQWRGSGWRVSNPATGEAGYFVSGGYAGGITAIAPERWFLRSIAEALENPYATLPNLDPLSAALIQLDASSQRQYGKAGEFLEQSLFAYISDDVGRPVLGATVTFAVIYTEGGLAAAGSSDPLAATLTAITDAFGIAEVRLRLPERLDGLGTNVLQEGLPFPQRVGIAGVQVSVTTARGELPAGVPYVAYAFPAVPASVEIDDGNTAMRFIPGLSYRHHLVHVRDRFGNPISNAEVAIRTEDELPQPPECVGHNLAQTKPSLVFADGACPIDMPSYHGAGCASPSIVVLSRPGGAPFNVVPTTAMATTIRIIAETAISMPDGASSTGTDVATNFTVGSIRASDGPQDPCLTSDWNGLVQWYDPLIGEGVSYSGHERSELSYGYLGPRSMEVARPGQTFPRSRRVSAATGSGTASIEWSNFRVPDITELHVENATAGNGRSAGTAYEYDLVAGAAPGVVTGWLRWRGRPDDPQTASFPIPDAHVLELSPADVAPQPLPINAFQRSDADLKLTASWTPGTYAAKRVSVALLEEGQSITDRQCEFPFAGSGGYCSFGRGSAFDPAMKYFGKVAINHGTPYYMESEPVEVKLGRGLIAGYGVDSTGRPLAELRDAVLFQHPLTLTLEHEVDIPNGYYCAVSARFVYAISQPARVSLTFFAVDPRGEPGAELFKPLDEVPKSADLHDLDIHPSDLPIGNFAFELKVTADDGVVEIKKGTVSNEVVRRDALPLAHSFVKGVDLFDGKAIVSAEDAALGGRGPGLAFTRTYSSHSGHDVGPLGRGWSSDLDSQVVADRCGTLTVTGGAGQGQRFTFDAPSDNGDTKYKPLHGYHGTLIRRVGGAFDFYSKNGTRYHFARNYAHGSRLSWVEDPNGNRVRYEYVNLHGGLQVSRIIDAAGRALDFTYTVTPVAESDIGDQPISVGSHALLTELRGPLGLRVKYEYSPFGTLLRVRRRPAIGSDEPGSGPPDVQRTAYEYRDYGWGHIVPPEGLLRTVRFGYRMVESRDDLDGNRRTYDYETGWSGFVTNEGFVYVPEKRVVTLVEPDDGTTGFVYPGINGLGAVDRTVSDARNFVTKYSLNGYGAVIKVEDPLGAITDTDWEPAAAQPEIVTDALRNVTTYTYDDHGNKTGETIVHSAGTLTRAWTYHPPDLFDAPIKDRIATYTDARGIVTTTSWDPRGNLLGTTRGGVTEAYGVAANGDRESHTDGENQTTQYRYDEYGYLIFESDTLGAIRSARFDARGRQLSEADGAGATTEFEYDDRDRRVLVRHPLAPLGLDAAAVRSEQHTVFDDAQRLRTEIDENARETRITHDRMGRVVEIRNAAGRARAIEYDPNGNTVRETDFRDNETTFVHDAANRLTRRHEPLGRSIHYDYDLLGHVLSETAGRRDGDEPLLDPRTTEYRYAHPSYLRTLVRRKLDDRWLETATQYDGNGNAERITDPRGAQTISVFDARDRLDLLTQPEGRITDYVYDNADRKVQETLSGPHLVAQQRTWSYDARGRERVRTDATRNAWTTDYDVAGNVERRTDPRDHSVTFGYDARHRLVLETGPVPGRETRFGYDAVGNRTHEVHANGRELRHDFDALNRHVASRDLAGEFDPPEFVRTVYDHDGNVTARRDGNGHETMYEVDALNRTHAEHRPLDRHLAWTHTIHGEVATGTDAEAATTTHHHDMLGRKVRSVAAMPFAYETLFGYDDAGNLASQTNGRGFTTTWTHDGLGRRTQQTDPTPAHPDPARRVQTWTFDAAGNVVAHVDRRGIESRFEYDAENRETARLLDGVRKASRRYDPSGNVATETDANGHVTTHAYNAANEKLSTTRPDDVVETWQRHPWGDVEVATDADGVATTFTYDLRRRVLSETQPHPDGMATTTHAYDGQGNRVTTQRPLGEAWRWQYRYDAAHRLEGVISPEGAHTIYTYDRADRRRTIDDAERHVTTTTLDALGRPIRVDHPNGDAERIDAYDANSNVTQRHDGNGQLIASTYDALDRITRRDYNGPAQPTDIVAEHWQYDPDGRITRIEQEQADATRHVTQRDWNRQAQLHTTTDRHGQITSNEYDPHDNRVARVDPEGRTVHTFDRLNRLRALQPPGEAAIAIAPTKAGRLQTQTAPNGASTSHDYDVAGRLATITHRQSGTVVATRTYSYDRNGNRTQDVQVTTDGTRTTTYTYDRDDRLTGTTVTDEAGIDTDTVYTLDRVGNRRTERVTRNDVLVANWTYDYDHRNQLDSRADSVGNVATTYSYDGNGFTTSETTNGSTTTYRPNLQDRLATLTTPTGPPVHYAYDPDGLRVEKRSTAEATRFGYDGTTLRRETNVTNNPLVRYDWASGRILRSRSASLTSYAQHDALKTPTRWSRADGGEQARASFDAWGNLATSSGVLPNVRYTGYYADAESTSYYAQQRYYVPNVGRFNRTDSWIGDPLNPVTLNKYLYAVGNSLIYLDPDGRQFCGQLCDAGFRYGFSTTQEERVAAMRHGANTSPVVGVPVGVTIRASQMASAPGAILADAINGVGGDEGAADRTEQRLQALRDDVHGNAQAMMIFGPAGPALREGQRYVAGVADDVSSFQRAKANNDYVGVGEVVVDLTADATALMGAAGGMRAALSRAPSLIEQRVVTYRRADEQSFLESAYQTPVRIGVTNQPDPARSIDTRIIENPTGKTAQGFPRDNIGFWREWDRQHPEMLSDVNRMLMNGINPRTGKSQRPVSPRIDQTWLQHNRGHEDYAGETLIHHHAIWRNPETGKLEPGPYALPVPQPTHFGQERIWHGPFIEDVAGE